MPESVKVTLDQIKKTGYKDGAQMANESGDSNPGVDGWDGLLINAIGMDAVCDLFGVPRGTETTEMESQLKAYCEGAQAGADEAVN